MVKISEDMLQPIPISDICDESSEFEGHVMEPDKIIEESVALHFGHLDGKYIKPSVFENYKNNKEISFGIRTHFDGIGSVIKHSREGEDKTWTTVWVSMNFFKRKYANNRRAYHLCAVLPYGESHPAVNIALEFLSQKLVAFRKEVVPSRVLPTEEATDLKVRLVFSLPLPLQKPT